MLNVCDVYLKVKSDVTKLHVELCLQFTWLPWQQINLCFRSENMKDCSKFIK